MPRRPAERTQPSIKRFAYQDFASKQPSISSAPLNTNPAVATPDSLASSKEFKGPAPTGFYFIGLRCSTLSAAPQLDQDDRVVCVRSEGHGLLTIDIFHFGVGAHREVTL